MGRHSAFMVSATIALAISLTADTASSQSAFPAIQRAEPFRELTRQAEQDLTSSEPVTVAWGAYRAGTYHLVATIPLLQRVLESPPLSTDPLVRRELVNVLLDALLQLNAALPAPLIDRFVADHPVQALALMASASGREPVLLDRLKTAQDMPWLAIANILLQDESQGLAVHLLGTLRLRLRITVTDDSDAIVGGGAGGMAGGDGIGQSPVGFPPHAEYRFEIGARPGFVVLATGPRPVYYSRQVTTDWQYGTSSVHLGGPNDRVRVDYLNAMIGRAMPGSGLQAETSENHRWTTAAALLQAVDDLRAAIVRKYDFFVSELVRFNRLSAAVAPTLPPHIDAQLVDERRDKSVPLPVVPPQAR
jgi:hypothetical protein